MRTTELVRSVARRIPKAALTRIQRALENRGMIPRPNTAPVAKPAAEDMVPYGDQWGPSPATLPGIDLCVPRQLELLEQMRRFSVHFADAQAAMQRVVAPKKIVEWDRTFPREKLKELEAGDFLLVESKELAQVLFDVLPALSAGVYVQFRPVLYPFRGADLLRAFLQYNRDFQIRFWPSYLYQHCRDRLAAIPQLNADAATLWIRKVS